MKNLWESIDINNYEQTDKLITFLNKQGEYLAEKTNNRVEGRVVEPQNAYSNNIAAMVEGMSSRIEMLQKQMNIIDSINQDDGIDREDADTLYKKTQCSFEIYSNKYRFKVFRLVYGPIFPIQMIIDEDIVREEKSFFLKLVKTKNASTEVTIHSFEEFEDCVREIFNSRKIRYLINRLMQSVSEDTE